jgi:hypothetical protein
MNGIVVLNSFYLLKMLGCKYKVVANAGSPTVTDFQKVAIR